eukprot:jgi/Psemu1/40199/gm1.40199_g
MTRSPIQTEVFLLQSSEGPILIIDFSTEENMRICSTEESSNSSLKILIIQHSCLTTSQTKKDGTNGILEATIRHDGSISVHEMDMPLEINNYDFYTYVFLREDDNSLTVVGAGFEGGEDSDGNKIREVLPSPPNMPTLPTSFSEPGWHPEQDFISWEALAPVICQDRAMDPETKRQGCALKHTKVDECCVEYTRVVIKRKYRAVGIGDRDARDFREYMLQLPEPCDREFCDPNRKWKKVKKIKDVGAIITCTQAKSDSMAANPMGNKTLTLAQLQNIMQCNQQFGLTKTKNMKKKKKKKKKKRKKKRKRSITATSLCSLSSSLFSSAPFDSSTSSVSSAGDSPIESSSALSMSDSKTQVLKEQLREEATRELLMQNNLKNKKLEDEDEEDKDLEAELLQDLEDEEGREEATHSL